MERHKTVDYSNHNLKTHDFWYDLPEELIAQTPAEKRDDIMNALIDLGVDNEIAFKTMESVRKGETIVESVPYTDEELNQMQKEMDL